MNETVVLTSIVKRLRELPFKTDAKSRVKLLASIDIMLLQFETQCANGITYDDFSDEMLFVGIEDAYDATVVSTRYDAIIMKLLLLGRRLETHLS